MPSTPPTFHGGFGCCHKPIEKSEETKPKASWLRTTCQSHRRLLQRSRLLHYLKRLGSKVRPFRLGEVDPKHLENLQARSLLTKDNTTYRLQGDDNNNHAGIKKSRVSRRITPTNRTAFFLAHILIRGEIAGTGGVKSWSEKNIYRLYCRVAYVGANVAPSSSLQAPAKISIDKRETKTKPTYADH